MKDHSVRVRMRVRMRVRLEIERQVQSAHAGQLPLQAGLSLLD